VTGDYNITDHQVQHRPAVQQAFDDVAGGGLSVPAGEPDSGCGHAVHRSVGRQLLQPYRSPRDQWQRYDDTTGGGQVYFYRRGWEVPRAEHDELQTYRAGGTLSGDFQLGDHSWNWDVGAYVNTNDLSQIKRGDFTTPHRRRWAVVLRSGHRQGHLRHA
jgi:hypothetical protein